MTIWNIQAENRQFADALLREKNEAVFDAYPNRLALNTNVPIALDSVVTLFGDNDSDTYGNETLGGKPPDQLARDLATIYKVDRSLLKEIFLISAGGSYAAKFTEELSKLGFNDFKVYAPEPPRPNNIMRTEISLSQLVGQYTQVRTHYYENKTVEAKANQISKHLIKVEGQIDANKRQKNTSQSRKELDNLRANQTKLKSELETLQKPIMHTHEFNSDYREMLRKKGKSFEPRISDELRSELLQALSTPLEDENQEIKYKDYKQNLIKTIEGNPNITRSELKQALGTQDAEYKKTAKSIIGRITLQENVTEGIRDIAGIPLVNPTLKFVRAAGRKVVKTAQSLVEAAVEAVAPSAPVNDVLMVQRQKNIKAL